MLGLKSNHVCKRGHWSLRLDEFRMPTPSEKTRQKCFIIHIHWFVRLFCYFCSSSSGPFHEHGLTIMPAWINNFMHYEIYLSIPKLQRLQRRIWRMDYWFPTLPPTLYWACDYLYMLVLKFKHVSKKGPGALQSCQWLILRYLHETCMKKQSTT